MTTELAISQNQEIGTLSEVAYVDNDVFQPFVTIVHPLVLNMIEFLE